MTRKYSSTLKQFTSIGMLAALVMMPYGAEGFVLCRGEDGHLEIELASRGSCFTCIDEDEHPFNQASSIEGTHCGVCVDLALSSAHSGTATRKNLFSALAFWVPEATASVYPDRLTAPLYSQPPPTSPATLVRLKTVRLLI